VYDYASVDRGEVGETGKAGKGARSYDEIGGNATCMAMYVLRISSTNRCPKFML
jgi:hypothetical protein